MSADNFCWLFNEIFEDKDGIKFTMRDLETGKNLPLQRDNSQQTLTFGAENFFFGYLRLNRDIYPSIQDILMGLKEFWQLTLYLIERSILVCQAKHTADAEANDTKESLLRTLDEYKHKLLVATDPQVKSALLHTIDFLQVQLEQLNRPEERAAGKLIETKTAWHKSLKELFIFYSKQQKVARKEKTFDNYKDELQNMSVGEWLRFCKDFDLNPQHWDRKGLDSKGKEKHETLVKLLNNTTLSNLYKLESMGALGVSYDSFEKMLRKVCTKLSPIYGFEDEKIFEIFSRMGLLDGTYRNRMKMMNKPFFAALHYPAFTPFQKEDTSIPQMKHPNLNVNQEVFTRLYDRAIADTTTKRIISDLNGQHPNTIIALNHQTGVVEIDPMLLNGGRQPSANLSRAPGSAKLLGKGKALSSVASEATLVRGIRPQSKLPPPTFGGMPKPSDNDSYLIRERARHLQDTKKKFTWENLEKMNINELKGITQVNFDPASLIGAEDEEDKLYMQEYNQFANSSRGHAEKPVKETVTFQHYGDIKRRPPGAGTSADSPKLKPMPVQRVGGGSAIRKGGPVRAQVISNQMNDKYRQSLDMIRGNLRS